MKLIEDFNDIPSLEFLTASQFVITIWNRPDIVLDINDAFNITDNKKFFKKLDDIDARILKISRSIETFPFLLKKDLEVMISPVGNKIKEMRYLEYFSPYLKSDHWEFPVDHWTHYGTVDIKKIDKILVQDERRDIHFRFYLACHNCFEENINELFPLLSEREKSKYRVILRYKELLSYWTYRLEEKMYAFWIKTLDFSENQDPFAYSAHQVAFNYSMINGSKSAIEYFLDNLALDEILHSVRTRFQLLFCEIPDGSPIERNDEIYLDASYFLLSRLERAIRNNILSQYRFYVFMKFMNYPFFGLIRKFVNVYFNSLQMMEIKTVFLKFNSSMHTDTRLFGYDLFNDFWHNLRQDQKDRLLPQFRRDGRISLIENR